MHSARGIQSSHWMGCPIRTLRAQRSHAAPPERFAGLLVLHRPSAPGHPPRTLSCLWLPHASAALPATRTEPHAISCSITCGVFFLRTRTLARTSPLAFLCFSLLALGKIEVIMSLFGF